MTLFKKKMTEKEAALAFVSFTFNEAIENFPKIYNNLKEFNKEKFVIKNETLAIIDLSLATMSLNTRALKNLFPNDQAERIYAWVLSSTVEYLSSSLKLDTLSTENYLKEELSQYELAYQEGTNNFNMGWDGVSARLLRQWLGDNRAFFIDENGYWNSVLITFTSRTIVSFVGYWKNIKDNFKLN